VPEPEQADLHHRSERRQLVLQVPSAQRRQSVRTAPVLGGQGFNEAAILETRDRRVQRADAELDSRERLDVGEDGVAVRVAFGEAGEDE
jgi:hypothetical protein